MQSLISWDEKILFWINDFFIRYPHLFLEKFFAEYLIYTLPIVLIVLWFYRQETKKVALRVLFAVILAWPIIAKIINRLVKRPRPFSSGGVQELLFNRPDFSFPSDHAAALFAVAFSLWFSNFKKMSIVLFVGAIVISFFRVASGIHYPLDIIGGLVVGFGAAFVIFIFDKYLDRIYNFIIRLARKFKLA